ncbi:4-carboxy-2-hydroxymuconate-6-semialdehyde dehydrogenase [Polystyrenella longa]|uniref:4-carboxy-2-hydroxymuconate-6-semialdehyde dehydrogenase n=1 Tax=Polystyrenella longa TaxID=2528007 RepID=A0A518CQA5_9PLAN|nr:Gfo/Idh/MocA family oxidoreductase [Polystyrenella longa]QDU81384.1 4-carboxy-2-hydroxymuconate-6-semialdehyde dehydrogenase [Polystyrenella longa]
MKQALIVGGGSIGERHLRCFLDTSRVTASICDVNESLVASLKEKYKLGDCFTDFDKALDSKPDMVVICTPAHLHIPMAQACADRGIPVLIEKPLSTNFDGIDKLITTVKEKNLPVAVAYVTRANPILQDFRKTIQSERFGKPVQLVFTSGQHFPFYRPAYKEIYYNNRATGGGAIQDALTHGLNYCEWLIGPITKLVADADHKVLEGVEVEDTVHVIARHNNVMASYTLNQYQAPNDMVLTVACTEGTLRYEPTEFRWSWQVDPAGHWTHVEFPPMERDDGFVAQAEAFVDLCEGKAEPLCSLEDGYQTLKANLAILNALDSTNWQKLS